MNYWAIIKRIKPKHLWSLTRLSLGHPLFALATLKATKNCMGICNKLYGKKHTKDNVTNAFRHSLWNILIAKECAAYSSNTVKVLEWTKNITDWHEKIFPNKPLAKAMDLHNNHIGRLLYSEYTTLKQEDIISKLQKETAKAQKVTQVAQIAEHPNHLVYIESIIPIGIYDLQATDAMSLHALMQQNSSYFNRFFPKTLAANHSLTASQEYITKKIDQQGKREEYTLAIKLVTTQAIIGLVILKQIDWNNQEAEIAYCIDEKHTKKGYATLAVQLILEKAVKEYNLFNFYIIAHKNNLGSVAVAKRNGFIHEQTLVQHYSPPNENLLDMELYTLSLNHN